MGKNAKERLEAETGRKVYQSCSLNIINIRKNIISNYRV